MKIVLKMVQRARCGRCHRRPVVVGRLCGTCYATDVLKFEDASAKAGGRLKVK